MTINSQSSRRAGSSITRFQCTRSARAPTSSIACTVSPSQLMPAVRRTRARVCVMEGGGISRAAREPSASESALVRATQLFDVDVGELGSVDTRNAQAPLRAHLSDGRAREPGQRSLELCFAPL